MKLKDKLTPSTLLRGSFYASKDLKNVAVKWDQETLFVSSLAQYASIDKDKNTSCNKKAAYIIDSDKKTVCAFLIYKLDLIKKKQRKFEIKANTNADKYKSSITFTILGLYGLTA